MLTPVLFFQVSVKCKVNHQKSKVSLPSYLSLPQCGQPFPDSIVIAAVGSGKLKRVANHE